MNVISIFDPWRSPLCTCPRKYTLSPYTGCSHACRYCYITSYILQAFNARPKRDFLAKLCRDLTHIEPDMHISITNSSDPYTPPEGELQLTRQTLKLLLDAGARVQLITKSNLVIRDVDILERGNFTVSLTITTLDKEKTRKLEPYAPPPQSRLDALKKLTSHGIPCTARIDPIIPGINEDNLSELARAVREVGVEHVVASTYKARRDSFNRVVEAFPELKDSLTQAYWVEGEIYGRTRYLRRSIREDILRELKDIVEGQGMTYGICREGLGELNSGETCDGSHLIPMRIEIKREL